MSVYSDHRHFVRRIRELVIALVEETDRFQQMAVDRLKDAELDRAVVRSTECLRPAVRGLLLAIVALRQPHVETIGSELD